MMHKKIRELYRKGARDDWLMVFPLYLLAYLIVFLAAESLIGVEFPILEAIFPIALLSLFHAFEARESGHRIGREALSQLALIYAFSVIIWLTRIVLLPR